MAPLLLAAIPLAAQAIFGTFQYLSAVKNARKNLRPEYEIDPTFQQNIDFLKNTMGLPQSALELYYNRVGHGTSQGIEALLASGGNANQIATILGNQNRSFQEIALQDALQKKQDIGGIINANLMLAGEKDKAFQINEYAPYSDKAQALSAQKSAGLQNIGGAITGFSSALANNETNKLAEKLLAMGTDAQKLGTTGEVQTITTPNEGVNINKIMQSLMPNRSPFFNQNQMSLGNIPAAPQINFNQPAPFNPFNQNLYFGQQSPMNFSTFNPNQLSLYNLQNYQPYPMMF